MSCTKYVAKVGSPPKKIFVAYFWDIIFWIYILEIISHRSKSSGSVRKLQRTLWFGLWKNWKLIYCYQSYLSHLITSYLSHLITSYLSLDFSDISQHSVAEGTFLLIGLAAVVTKQKMDLIWEIILYGIKSASVVTSSYILA